MKEYFLKTSRIGFSTWNDKDITLAMRLWQEADVTHYISANGIFTLSQIEARLKLEIENYQQYGVQYFPIFELESLDLIGCCGLHPAKNEADVYEIGFHLRKKYWHQDYGLEAAKAMIEYSFKILKASKLVAGHHPQNIASKKLIQKLGFKYTDDEYYEPTGLYHPSYYLTNDN